MGTILSILVVSSIAAALAAALVIAQRFIADYGECEITINDARSVKVRGGGSLLESLTREGVFIPSACGGRGTCAYCTLRVLEGGGPILPTEEPYLDAGERQEGMRLSCQVKLRNDIRIEIPEKLFAVRQYTCRCTRIRKLTHDIREFRLELQNPPEIDYLPGQYVQLSCPAYGGNEEVYRAYSIASDPAERKIIDLVIHLVPGGICTTWCFNCLEEGDEVLINGPYGEFGLSETKAPMVFVAGGSGMAPMKCMLQHMKNRGNDREVTYFFGVNTVEELFYTDLMNELERQLPNLHFVPVVARPEPTSGWTGETGLVTDALAGNAGNLANHEGYLCGSPGMIDAAIGVLKSLGMRDDNTFFDKF